ncbi:MAG: S4 domain-containing protein, partial [Flavobacteriales bacterium]|nr:S4 domain-containing protein [Flavobacteriales bacterium]
MEGFEVRHPGTLVDALTMQGGYTTRTRARKAIKNGAVKLEGNVVRIPSTVVEPGMNVTHDRGRKTVSNGPGQSMRDSGRFNTKTARSPSKPPFDVVYEDDNFLAYIKPSGWVTAAPNPQVTTSYSRMKSWLEQQGRGNRDLHFVNKLMKDVSGICLIAKNKVWREHLQENWNDFRQGIYILVEGHLPPDDELECSEENGDRVQVQYRTMRATQKHTLLKVDAPIEAIQLIMPSLRRESCIIIGKGKTAPDPLNREGVHMFALEVSGPKGGEIMVKSRVPREFLGLMKGGETPKPNKRRNAEVKFGKSDRGDRPLVRRARSTDKWDNKTTDKPAEKKVELKVEKTFEKPVEKTFEKPVAKPVAKPFEKKIVTKVETPVETKVEKPALKPAAKKVAKPAAKPVVKKVAKPAAKKAAKPAAKKAAKPAVKKAAKPAAKKAAKPVVKK